VSDSSRSSASNNALLAAIGIVLAGYLAAAIFHLPQDGTRLVLAGQSRGTMPEQSAEGDTEPVAECPAAGHPPYWMVMPFVLLLGAIAVLPLIPATAHWWESNLHRFYVAGGLAAITLAYYLALSTQPVAAHWPAPHVVLPSPGGLNLAQTGDVLANAILNEFVPFIVLLFSLYTISGGIRIEGDLPAHPLTNAAFLATGAVLASLIGTTGAAMLLIRPLLETNRERKHVKHTVIFFTFIVCNCGGLLLPLGDPPLFLGYLMGVPFLFTTVLWKEWLFVNGALLAIYLLWDQFWCYPHEQPADIARDESRRHRLRFSGIWPNVLLLVGVIFSVALLDPIRTLPGTDWHPWMYLREVVQLALVGLSLAVGAGHARRANRFNYGAIIEVAVLFFGIFICMQPALQILAVRGSLLGLNQPWHFFWASGSLSSVLDNAPTYVVFFESAKSLTEHLGLRPTVGGVQESLLIAVSLGSVFMGANTYIGNGPNFMVKSIAEKSGVAMPSFFGYMLYSVGILVPLFVLVTLLFL
jgi:Na+/H+ antiporter NhaD/arsenite permease-like protein